MSKYLERAKQMRKIEEPHYNCCQAVTVPFAKECGMVFECVSLVEKLAGLTSEQ